ncbi:hypothetical protein PSYJA_10381 [Pseudomonas syringae pv. japonica str. M301072]|uniref:Uncharacterized protein n=1 Tax=Pseudomonas syringae pv. japonica str. M301072 TaxID=629262 RepID=F3FGL5_PSESX|nr:hypothetical protein PSYJA_10381 [Pseudomonas syringae pv. japonica str. M301072]
MTNPYHRVVRATGKIYGAGSSLSRPFQGLIDTDKAPFGKHITQRFRRGVPIKFDLTLIYTFAGKVIVEQSLVVFAQSPAAIFKRLELNCTFTLFQFVVSCLVQFIRFTSDIRLASTNFTTSRRIGSPSLISIPNLSV